MVDNLGIIDVVVKCDLVNYEFIIILYGVR